jgi:NAD(P)-dependent dehydrogenase (short-subunit alcohol dehydrogenase family)
MISTPMLIGQGMGLSEEQVEQFKKSVLNNVPLVGNPDEIAKAVAFLASDDSTGIELFAKEHELIITCTELMTLEYLLTQN